MLGEAQEELLRVVGTSIKIDHHVSQPEEDFADLSLVDPSRGSTAEIVLHIAEALSWRVDKVAAECLFAGAASDSGWFKYSKSGESLRAAGALIDFGADARNIAQNLEMQTKKDILIEAIAVANAEFFYKDRLVVAMITREMYKNLNGKAELAMDLLCRIKAVEYVAVIKEAAPGRIHVSFRSKTSPVRGVAEKFGGGGHDFAAAANLEGEPGAIKAAVVAAFANL
jgi:phosphoesterase RecJ-like protein